MGEITMSDEFGQAIARIIEENQYRQNLEIGSWDGSGSTQCFIEGMKKVNGNRFLYCVEYNAQRRVDLIGRIFEDSKIFPIIVCTESSIRKSSFVPKSFDEIWDSKYNGHREAGVFGRELVKSWYDHDMIVFDNMPQLSVLDDLVPKAMKFDAVLIDGGEFAGYSEYLLLKDRVKCFFLDDVHKAYKCNQVYHELLENSDWELLQENPELRNGFAIFRRK